MKNLAAYIHSKGLKAGIYSDAGKIPVVPSGIMTNKVLV